jgi:nicotinamide phosphoribosyltransferase
MKINPFLLTDAYKVSHPEQYPTGTEYVYSNVTPRHSRIAGINSVVVFGIQYFIKEYLMEQFEENFFNRDKQEVLDELKEFFTEYFGPDKVNLQRYADLHDLGYLPLKIKALPEGTKCPIGVPFVTILNTDPKFYWLTNFIETLSQTVIWNPITSATLADRYRVVLNEFADKTVGNREHVKFQAHNFSMRGMSSVESGLTTDAGHLLSFVGSDTLPGNLFVKRYYNAKGFISCSVPATEHAVMCAGKKEDEQETFRRLIEDVYPNGIVSIVSDTWDLWKVLTEIAPNLRDVIEARDGKVVFRPDSGDPVKIVCGYTVAEVQSTSDKVKECYQHDAQQTVAALFGDNEVILTKDGKYLNDNMEELTENEVKGCVQILAEQFGTTVNMLGYKELNPKVGLIYGDSITYERCLAICQQLEQKGFASNNVVFGVGSYTYQYNTRDTFSIACKATWVVVDGEAYNIFKDPITDDGKKKSACGLLKVERFRGSHGTALMLKDQVSLEEEEKGELITVFENGKLVVDHNFECVKERLCR